MPDCRPARGQQASDPTLYPCGWRLAQLRWPFGLWEAARQQPRAEWITIMDDDTFLVIPTVLHMLGQLNVQHGRRPVYAMGQIAAGGTGHYFNRAWIHRYMGHEWGRLWSRNATSPPSSRRASCLGVEGRAALAQLPSEGALLLCHTLLNLSMPLVALTECCGAKTLDEADLRGIAHQHPDELDSGGYRSSLWQRIRLLDPELLSRDAHAFAQKHLTPVTHVSLKYFGENAQLLYRLLYHHELSLLSWLRPTRCVQRRKSGHGTFVRRSFTGVCGEVWTQAAVDSAAAATAAAS